MLLAVIVRCLGVDRQLPFDVADGVVAEAGADGGARDDAYGLTGDGGRGGGTVLVSVTLSTASLLTRPTDAELVDGVVPSKVTVSP